MNDDPFLDRISDLRELYRLTRVTDSENVRDLLYRAIENTLDAIVKDYEPIWRMFNAF